MAERERSDGRTKAIRGLPARGTVSCSAQPTATAAETGPLGARVVEANGGAADASREQQEPREGWMSSESAGTASRPSGMPKATSFPPEERANTNPQRARTFPSGSRPLVLQSGAPVADSKANRLPVSVRARRASPPGESWTTRSPGSSRSHPAVKRKGAGGGSDDAVGYEATRESGRRLTCPMGGDAPTGLPSNTSGSVVASAAGRATMRSRAEQKDVTVGGIYHLPEPTLVPIMSLPLLSALC